MGDHRFTCHPHSYPQVEWAILPLLPSRSTSPHFGRHTFSIPLRVEGWVGAWVAGYILRWFACLKMVTHPSTNWARHRITSLTHPTPLRLRQTAIKLTFHCDSAHLYHLSHICAWQCTCVCVCVCGTAHLYLIVHYHTPAWQCTCVCVCACVCGHSHLEFSCLSQLLDIVAFLQVCVAILVAVKFLQNDSQGRTHQQ